MAFWILHILRTLSKNRHGNFAVSSFVGVSIEENIHESESTRTLLAKASKLNMYIHNIHLHIFSIKLISPVIAVYKQTVFPISLNCPTIPYKNFGGYPWKKIEKNIHENRLLCCNLYVVSPIIGTFRSDSDYDYEYEISNYWAIRMRHDRDIVT